MTDTVWPEQEELQAWRHDFHRHPETAFEEHRTSARVAELLRSWGLEVHTGLAGTGLVAATHACRNSVLWMYDASGYGVMFRASYDACSM